MKTFTKKEMLEIAALSYTLGYLENSEDDMPIEFKEIIKDILKNKLARVSEHG